MPTFIEFEGQTGIAAKDQPEYLPLPFHRDRNDPEGKVTACVRFTPEEIAMLIETHCLYVTTLNFAKVAITPLCVNVVKPDWVN